VFNLFFGLLKCVGTNFIPRNDSNDFNIKGQIISVMIKDKLRGNTTVSFCDNSNMCYKGEALSLYISDQDGISIPASNIVVESTTASTTSSTSVIVVVVASTSPWVLTIFQTRDTFWEV
jgi:hypothetical protein